MKLPLIIKRRKIWPIINKEVLSPGLLIFVVGIIVTFIAHQDRCFIGNDEFSFWGISVKSLFAYNALPLRSNGGLLNEFLSYPLGSGLLSYMISKINSFEFIESYSYIAMNCMYAAISALFFISSKRSDFFLNISLAVVLFLMPMMFFGNYYYNLQVDALLAFVLAGAFYILATQEMDIVTSIVFTLFLSFLILVKQSGTGLAIIALLYPTLCVIKYLYRVIVSEVERKKNISLIWLYIIPVSAFMVKILQNILVQNSKITFSAEKITIINIYNAFCHNIPGHFYNIIRLFNETTFYNKFIKFSGVEISLFGLYIICIMIMVIVINSYKKTELKKLYPITSIICIGMVAYVFTLLLYYGFSFSVYEGSNLASFSRYMGTYMLFMSMLIVALAFNSFNLHKKNNLRYIILFIAFLPLVNSPAYYWQLKGAFSTPNNKELTIFEIAEQSWKQHLNNEDKFIVVGQEYKAYEFLASRYYRPLQYFKGASFGTPQYTGDIWSLNYTKEQFKNLNNDAKFCYILNTNQFFDNEYGELFKPSVKKNRLYKFQNDYYYLLPMYQFELDFKKISMLNIEQIYNSAIKYSVHKQSLQIKIQPKGYVPFFL